MRQKRNSGTKGREHAAPEATGSRIEPDATGSRIDLSVPQVAGSALAAVAAAVLASQLGVYGTVIGAGVVSVVVTCGGPLIQHVFSRTGEQLREVTVQARPKGGRAPVADATRTCAGGPPEGRNAPAEGEFGEASAYRARVRGWKRPAAAAAVVFAVAMAGVTGYELVAGEDLSGGKGTTVGSAFDGGRGGGEAEVHPESTPGSNDTPSRSPDGGAAGVPEDDRGEDADPPGAGDPDPSGSTGPAPGPSQSAAPDTGVTAPAPAAPSPSTSDAGTEDQDPALGTAPAEGTGTAPAGP